MPAGDAEHQTTPGVVRSSCPVRARQRRRQARRRAPDTPAQVRALTGRASYGEHHGDSCAQRCGTPPSRRHGQPDAEDGHLHSQPVRGFGAQPARFWLQHRPLARDGQGQVEGPPGHQAGAAVQSFRDSGWLDHRGRRGRVHGPGPYGRRGQPRARAQCARAGPAAPTGRPRPRRPGRGHHRRGRDLVAGHRAGQAARHGHPYPVRLGCLGGADPPRPAGLAVPPASGQQRRHRADGDRLGGTPAGRTRPDARGLRHAGHAAGHRRDQAGRRPDRLRGGGAARRRADEARRHPDPGAGRRIRPAGHHRHAAASRSRPPGRTARHRAPPAAGLRRRGARRR